MSEVVEIPKVREPGSGLDDNWRVIVLNDDHNTFDHVANTLARTIPGVTVAGGYAFADKIHNTGRAIVWAGIEGDGRAVLGAARAGGPHHGPARAGLSSSIGSPTPLRASSPAITRSNQL